MNPLDVDAAVAALTALNGDDRPYEITAKRTGEGAEIRGAWKVYDVRWEGLFGRGTLKRDYVLLVHLDRAKGQYRFVETDTSAESSLSVGPGGVQVKGQKRWFRGKTFGQREFRVEIGPKVTAKDRTGVTEGSVWTHYFTAADLKRPVFTTLRDLGWRPPRDGRWARLLEDSREPRGKSR